MDQIRIKGLEIFAHHGVYPEEKEKGQHFFLDAVLYTDTRRAGLTDRLELSTDYGEVCRLMNEVMCAQTYDLIEQAAEQTAQEVLLAFPLIRRLELELHKPEAPIPLPFGDVSVRIERGWHRAFVAFGSNMGDKEYYLEKGLKELKEQQEKPVSASSSHNILAEASRLIQTTPQTFFTGKDLADRFFVCERTLSNQFKKAYGKTLYAYQMDVKLEMVRQFLLSQPEVKLHETALNFGFCDEFHMSRTFKRKYGVSPSQYRQENLGS